MPKQQTKTAVDTQARNKRRLAFAQKNHETIKSLFIMNGYGFDLENARQRKLLQAYRDKVPYSSNYTYENLWRSLLGISDQHKPFIAAIEKPLKPKERELIKTKIEIHGFSVAMEERLSPSKIKNEEFHRLREQFLAAEAELKDFIYKEYA